MYTNSVLLIVPFAGIGIMFIAIFIIILCNTFALFKKN